MSKFVSGGKVIIVGDVMMDLFVEGVVARISPEAPCPVFLSNEHGTATAGGAANVAANVAALGAEACLIGIVGSDEEGEALLGRFPDLLQRSDRETITKTRFTVRGQHLLRVDREFFDPLPGSLETEIFRRVEGRIDDAGCLVISDYEKGLVTENLARRLVDLARKRGILTVVDTKKSSYVAFAGAYVVTPNRDELQGWVHWPLVDRQSLQQAALTVRGVVDNVLVTLGPLGALLAHEGPIEGADPECHFIAARRREVSDVCGAGDTVTAMLAVCLANNIKIWRAAGYAMAAAACVVDHRGVVPVDCQELAEELDREERKHPWDFSEFDKQRNLL